MPNLRTDDGPRKLRAVWLGPKGATLPFEWTYVQWSAVLIAVVVVPLLLGPLVWLATGDVAWGLILGIVWGGPTGAYLAVRLMRRVTFDEPLRYKVQLLKDIRRNHYKAAGQRRDRMPMPSITRLAEPTLTSLRWPTDHPAHTTTIEPAHNTTIERG